MHKNTVYIVVLFGVFFLFPTSAFCAETDSDALSVFVSIVPQLDFVERVGGSRVEVEALVQPGESPHMYNPTPRQMTQLAGARLFFRIGVAFENAVIPKLERLGGHLTIVDTRRNIPLRALEEPDVHSDSTDGHVHNEPAGEYAAFDHADPHIWLAPPLIKIQVVTIADALIAVDPAHAEEYRKNLAVFLDEIDATHKRIAHMLEPCKGRRFYCFHPSYGYFADTYGLHQIPVEIEGKSPTPKQLRDLIARAKADKAQVIFVQPQFDSKSAEQVGRGIGGRVVPLDPLACDVLGNLEIMARAIRKACSP